MSRILGYTREIIQYSMFSLEIKWEYAHFLCPNKISQDRTTILDVILYRVLNTFYKIECGIKNSNSCIKKNENLK